MGEEKWWRKNTEALPPVRMMCFGGENMLNVLNPPKCEPSTWWMVPPILLPNMRQAHSPLGSRTFEKNYHHHHHHKKKKN